MKEKDIDCMKYRKSTHLAGVDVEMIIADKGKCELTIKEAFYETGVNVSGNKTDGYFITFEEPVKPMVVNSGNRVEISKIVNKLKSIPMIEARNIGNWKGVKIALYFDPNVKMMGQVVGGIKVSPEPPELMTDAQIKTVIDQVNKVTNLADLTTLYNSDVKFRTNKLIVEAMSAKGAELKKPETK